jgi:hypothetical protein
LSSFCVVSFALNLEINKTSVFSLLWDWGLGPFQVGKKATKQEIWKFHFTTFIQVVIKLKHNASFLSVLLFVCFVFSCLSNFSAIRRLSPLPVTGLQIWAYARRSGPLSMEGSL